MWRNDPTTSFCTLRDSECPSGYRPEGIRLPHWMQTDDDFSADECAERGGGVIGTQRIAWVTGGGTGIGKALAEAMYREGYWVVISGRRKEVLVNAAQEIMARSVSGQPGDIWAQPGDVSDPAYVAEVQRAVRERWGDIDILVNNAGENPHHTFQE